MAAEIFADVPHRIRAASAALMFYAACAQLAGCAGDPAPPAHSGVSADTAILYVAASLARPIQPLLDTLRARQGILTLRESGGSLDHARKITELGRVPDVLLLADAEVFPERLAPAHVRWWVEVARTRMVIAFTPRSRDAARITADNWRSILTAPGVRVGRADPHTAPAGARALAVMGLAERFYHDPGLAARLLAAAPDENVRPDAAQLATLLQLGELDYVFEYESVARTLGLRWVSLPPEIDLGDPERAAQYGSARPIVYAASIPTAAPHPHAARALLALILSSQGRALLRAAGVDVLSSPRFAGDVPDSIRVLAR